MCTISSKLKLCACKTKNVYSLKNYWVLHRFVKGQNVIVLGETIYPFTNPLVDKKLNEETLLALLNNRNIFDSDIEFKEKDLLHIAFNFDGKYQGDYGFKFKKGQWVNVGYEVFLWMQQHEEIKWGKIIHHTL